jgi:multidrug resistance protein MdtO
MSVSLVARLGQFLRAELGTRPGRLRAALRIVVPSLGGAVLIMLFQIPHGGWAILSIFTVSQADAGASLQRGLERLLGTIAGGIAGLLAIIAFIDLPYVFVPALGLAVVAGVYLSHVMAAPYPPLLGVMTYVLVTLSHVEFPEDYVDVALWRIAAIGMGVVLGTVAQLFLWPDDPVDKLRGALARRLHLVRGLVDQAIAPSAIAPTPPSAAMLMLGDLTAELQLLANAEVLHGHLRARHAEHTALILEVARLFTSALWAAETTPATAARVGLDDAVRGRLLAISEESARLARALESRRGLLGSTRPTASIPVEAGAGPAVSSQAPVLDVMERSLGRIAFLTGAPRPDGASRPGGPRMTELTPGMLLPIDVSEPTMGARSWSLRSGSLDTAALKLGLKAALGLELCYLVMLGLDWPGLVTSAVTCVIIAQTTVGATLSKAVLRQVGAVLGGLLGLIAIVVFMPNLHDLTSFLVVLGAGYLVAAWITVGGPRTAYAGIQTALALGIVLLSGFGPTTELVGARDRVLGILLGAAVMGVIDRVLWPVQARRAMRPTLARALRLMAELARVGARRGNGRLEDHPKGLRTKVYRLLSATLAYRDQSRMEGDPDTPEARAEGDMILHLVTDAQALLPGLFAAAGERLAAGTAVPRTAFAGHVEEFERTIADLLVATADSLEGGAAQGLAELRARARQLGDGVDAEPWMVPVDAAGDEAGARLESRHVTSHQLLRLVTRLAPDT